MERGMRCPACGERDRTARVSAIYLAAIEKKFSSRREDPPDFSAWEELPPGGLSALGKRLAPPSSGKQAAMRPVHPDWVVGAFSLLAPVFVYGMLTSQPQALWVVGPLLAAFYGVYFWQRRSMIEKYHALLERRRTADEGVRRGIERWLRLYYCARDDVVFSGAGRDVTPADEMGSLLLEERT